MTHDDTRGIRVRDHTIAGRDGRVAVRDYLPAEETGAVPLLWIHGGGFSTGGLDQKESDAPARALAARGRPVRTVDYRLVPGRVPWRKPDPRPHANQYPAALHDVVDAYLDLTSGGASGAVASGTPVALGGASAGACLAASATRVLQAAGGSGPAALVLVYGTFHARLPRDPEVEEHLRGVARLAFGPTMVERMNVNYVRDPGLLVPGDAFPGAADVVGFPPALLLDAENDRLRSSGTAFARELARAGVDTQHEVIAGSMHAFLGAPTRPAFTDAIARIEHWLTRKADA